MIARSDKAELTRADVQPFLVNPKRKGGQIVASCPLCEGDDRGHHLYLKEAENGKLLLYCQKCNAPGEDLLKAFRSLGAKPAAKPQEEKPKFKRKIEEYDHIYKNPDGSEAYRKTRVKYDDGSKRFTFKYTDASGRTVFKKPENCNILYNLDLLQAALENHTTDTVYIVEGEKCADAMTAAGLLATTSNTGAQKSIRFTDTDNRILTSFPRRIIIPDNDEKGADYATAWGDVKVLSLPEIWPTCPKKGDVADYLANGGSAEKIRGYQFKEPVKLDRDFFESLDEYQMVEEDTLSAIYAVKDPAERARALAIAGIRASQLKVAQNFNRCWKAFLQGKAAKNIVGENLSCFPRQPFAIRTGEWDADADGVSKIVAQQGGNGFRREVASPIPIMPVEILCNVDDQTEKIRLAYLKDGKWQKLVILRSMIASSTKIIELADFGVEVNSDNSKNLVRYLADTVSLNPDILPRVRSISHFGWQGVEFVPYAADVKLDCEEQFRSIAAAFTPVGTVEEWAAMTAPLRKNLYLRLIMAASFASPIIQKVGALPFVLHLWGGTGSGKTVGMMVAASIWGDPKMGGLVRTMNMTINSMMATAAVLKNVPFFGDELQTIKSRYENYDTLIMRVCEGIDRGRMTNTILQKQATWENSFIFTGEEPCTQSVSGGGVQNRVIELECDQPVVKNGNTVVNALREQHGTAGSEFVKAVAAEGTLLDMYRFIFDSIIQQADTSEKQTMAISLMLTADEIARRIFWPSEEPLSIERVIPLLKTKEEIDVSERAYQILLDLLAENSGKFDSTFADAAGSVVWGCKRPGLILFNKSVLERELDKAGFSWNAVKKDWARKKYIDTTNQGRYVFKDSVDGITSWYVHISSEKDENVGM